MKDRTDPLAVLNTIPVDQIPVALAFLTARLLREGPVLKEDAPADDPLLSTEEVAALLRRPKRWVTRHQHALGGMKLGQKLFFKRSRIHRNLERRTT